jgi:hypothetical protein
MAGRRPRIRASNCAYVFNLFPAQTDDHFSVIREVRFGYAEGKVALGEWKREYDQVGNHIGYRVVPNRFGDAALVSGSSSSSITAREMRLNAGLKGRSQTARLSEDDRISRRHPKSGKALPPEDAVERAREKVRIWPQVGGLRVVQA